MLMWGLALTWQLPHMASGPKGINFTLRDLKISAAWQYWQYQHQETAAPPQQD